MRLRELPDKRRLAANAPPSLAAGIAAGGIGEAFEYLSRLKEKIDRGKGDPKEATKCLENVKKLLQSEEKNAKKSKDRQAEKFLVELDSLADKELEGLKQRK